MFSLFLVFAHRYSHLAMKISSINKLEGDIKIIKNNALSGGSLNHKVMGPLLNSSLGICWDSNPDILHRSKQ